MNRQVCNARLDSDKIFGIVLSNAYCAESNRGLKNNKSHSPGHLHNYT